jgi:enoyl-CoA hydratase/carnithine racemase
MACDFRVMARNAFISIPEVDLGFNYGWNSIPQMINLIGPARTKRLVLLGERIGAEDAERWGLVDYLADDGETDDTAFRLAERLAKKPKLSLQLSKKAINATASAFADTASHADMAQILLCFQSLKEQRQS